MRNFGRQAQLIPVLREEFWRAALRVRLPRQGYRRDAVAGGMTRSLNGRVALVTGSTGEGMGRSTALTLAREGADVVQNHGTNRRTSPANNRRLVDAIERLSARAIVVRADTAKGDDVRKMFRLAEQEFGPVDILVNNAGGPWHPRQDLAKVQDRAWQGVLRPEIDRMFHTIRTALPRMRRRRWGRGGPGRRGARLMGGGRPRISGSDGRAFGPSWRTSWQTSSHAAHGAGTGHGRPAAGGRSRIGPA